MQINGTPAWNTAGFPGDFLRQPGHFNRAECGFISLVAGFEPGAIDSLLERVAREDAEGHRYAAVELCELDTARRLGRHVIVMRGLAAQHAANANDRIKTPGRSQLLSREGNFECPRHSDNFDLSSLTDVVLHLRYTAVDGGGLLRQAARDAVIKKSPREGTVLLSARRDYANACHRSGPASKLT